MAIDTWIQVTVDTAMASKPDNADHRHTIAGGTANGGDVTFAFDSAKITSVSRALSVMAAVTRALLGRMAQ